MTKTICTGKMIIDAFRTEDRILHIEAYKCLKKQLRPAMLKEIKSAKYVEEIFQITITKLFEKLKMEFKYKGEESFWRYVTSTWKWTWWRYKKDELKERSLDEDKEIEDITDPDITDWKYDIFSKCLDVLNKSCREIIELLIDPEGYSQKEIAQKLNLTYEAARMKIHRCKQKLKECVNNAK